MGTVLYVGPENSGADALAAADLRVRTARSVPDAAAVARDATVDCAVVEREVGDGATLDAVAAVRERRPDLPVVCVSADPDGQFAAAATRRGATEYYPRAAAADPLADRVREYCPDEDGDATGGTETASGDPVDAGSTGPIDAGSAGPGETELPEPPADGGVDRAVPVEQAPDPSLAGDVDWTDALLDAVEDGLYVLDAEGRFVTVNEALAEMTGYAVEELVGASSATIIDGATYERAVEMVERLRAGETVEPRFESTIVPRDGEPFPAEDHVTPLTDEAGRLVGLAGVLRDVTERREREAALERYESIVEAVDDAVYALDDEGHFEVVNEAMTELTGYDRAELLGEYTSLIKDDETVAEAERKVRDMIRGLEVETSFELQILPKSGDPVTCEDHMTMLTDDDRFVGTAGVIRDITERKERERRLREARGDFADLLDTSRTLLGAHSREAVAETVTTAVAETLGFERNFVRLFDPDSERLEAVATSEDAVPKAERPSFAPGEGGPGRAFARGETLVYPGDFDEEIDLPDDIVEALYVPFGEQGVVSIGATERGAFDERDVSMAEILASNAAVAFERVDYEEELVQYRTVLENVQDMVYVVDESERFTLVTEQLANWLGYDREELIGEKPSKVLDDESAEQFESAIAELWHDDDDTVTIDTRLPTADGDARPATVDVSLLPVEDEYAGNVGVVSDRSELVETREKLAAQRDRFSYLFDNLPDAVVEGMIEDGQPVLTAVNEAFTDVFGFEEEQVVGEPLNEFILPPEEREGGVELDRRTAAGETTQAEVRRKTEDGYRDFLFRGIPYDSTGEDTVRGFGIYTDITEQKERERRLEVLNRVLRHNLRNDLNVVAGYAEMVATHATDDELVEWADSLCDKATEVATLGDRVRTLDRQMSRGSLRTETVDLAAVVEEVVANFRVDRPRATVEVDLDVERTDVVGDGRLTLALRELLENCGEHVGAEVHVRVSATREADRLLLRVADDGPGIPDDERSVVTESAEITQLTHGTGLGLWIVKWVCDSCGGHIRFEESSLGGTAVVLSLTPGDVAVEE